MSKLSVMDFFGILPFWQAAVVIMFSMLLRAVAKLYHDSLKKFIASYLELKLNVYRNRLRGDIAEDLVIGAYSRIENEIVAEVMKIFDINDRFSDDRQRQIPAELKRAAGRGVTGVLPTLMKYTYARTGKSLAAPLENYRSSEELSAGFWGAILNVITKDHSTHARTASIIAVTEQVETAKNAAIVQIKSKK